MWRLSRHLHDLAYLLLLALLSPWLAYVALWKGKYRQGFAEKLWGRVPAFQEGEFRVWLHAVSVGEVALLKPLIEEIARQQPRWECVISTTTRTGFELARKKYPDRVVFYCPLDFSWAVASAFRRIRPNLLLLAELELWPNLIAEAQRRGVAVAVVNGRLSERSFRGYRRFRWLLGRTFARLNLVVAQNAEYAQRFRALGAPRVAVSGSIKFDNAQFDRRNPFTQQLGQAAGIGAGEQVWIAGSTQAPEEELALRGYAALRADHPDLRLILVPRHPERFEETAVLIERHGYACLRRSQMKLDADSPLGDDSAAQIGADGQPPVILVDVIGELAAWWGLADVAFVGGSLGQRGGQNMLEPAAYGSAVCFGPNTWNFRDIVATLLAADAAVVVRDGEELTQFVRRCLEDPQTAAALGARARSVVQSQQGATRRTVDELRTLAPTPSVAPLTRAA